MHTRIVKPMHEEFKIIAGFPAYRVSNLGRIQSRWHRNGPNGVSIGERWKDLQPRSSGSKGKEYGAVCLCHENGKRWSVRVHILVATYFLGPKPSKKSCARHLDSNRKNNRWNNLAWGSYQDNENDKHGNGTWFSRISNGKLTPPMILKIRQRAASGESHDSIGKDFPVSRETITRTINRTIWKHI